MQWCDTSSEPTPLELTSELTGGGSEPMNQQPPPTTKITDITMSGEPVSRTNPNTLPPSVASSNTQKSPVGLGEEADGRTQPSERTSSTLGHQSAPRWPPQVQSAEGEEKAASQVAQRKSVPPPLSINSFIAAVASVTSSAGRCLTTTRLTRTAPSLLPSSPPVYAMGLNFHHFRPNEFWR
ncbi:unnamed protein product [Schistocephalus solidus]|uniref:Uncharacterized protein n=1 Tax=Schistocephalus solidus TaxID=70667 RepID=A0A183TJC3_SCHSO|nr:unnamed protein product [Schistocephalus solidus]